MKGCDIDVYVETSSEKNNLIISESESVKKMASRLKTFSSFDNVVDIPNARVPIVKCSHVETSVKCDISFKNQLSVLNTQFIKSCMEYDPRIRPITMCIRFWAMKHYLSGNGLEQKINNYALTLMIIFYFQIKGMLPSVKSLQDNDKDLSNWPKFGSCLGLVFTTRSYARSMALLEVDSRCIYILLKIYLKSIIQVTSS